ncbi:conserved Plasmodium protein, unknown function [Plasmodium vinckei lentum]|uniref:Uncharacterized protein n=1 Tax=Plasmodium vinckei lentum TaxID=138297 RepID=A0A6V7S025_PLAVN|nr:conserved Plasmodium protein, unknown function [Plasmodium vinckei lentum]
MINHFKKNISLKNYISTNCLKQKWIKRNLFFCSYASSTNNCNLYGVEGKTTLLNFHRIPDSVSSIKKIGIHSYNKNNSGTKSNNNKERVNLFSEKDKKENSNKNDKKNEKGIIMYYPENSRFPYVTICVILGMIGISSFFKILIYNLKNCDNENDLISQVDKILNYLDNYFIIYNFEENKKNTEYKNDIFNIKYLTSQFFLNENTLQCAVQLFTFFLASCFLEKHYGSLIYIGLFLCGTLFSNIATTLFCDLIKNAESLKFINFALIHPSGSMAFICAFCSIFFKNCAIWKNIPINCSIFIVPFLFSSFYGLLSLYKISKHNLEEVNEINNTNTYEDNSSIDKAKFDLENNMIKNIDNDDTKKNVQHVKEDTHKHRNDNFIPYKQNEALNILQNFLIAEKCDSIIKKQKKEHVFLNRKIQNLKKEALRNIDEINNKSEKIFFSLSSAFTDVFGIVLASTLYLFKILK